MIVLKIEGRFVVFSHNLGEVVIICPFSIGEVRFSSLHYEFVCFVVSSTNGN